MIIKNKFFKLVVFIGLGLFNVISYADVNGDLNNFFNSLGYASNATSPTAYQGQMAGFYSGGSVYMRNRVRALQMASLSLPGFNAGCGGIDLWNGGFSFINASQLENAMKNIINNAGSYAFMLGLETYLPQESNIMKFLEDLQNKVNQASLNSCEMGASLVGGVWPKTQTAEQQVCQTIGTSTGLFSDWAAAHQGCGIGGQANQAFAQGENDPRFKNMLLGQGNLAWQALQQNPWIASDTQLAELLISLSGSIIINKNYNGLPEPTVLQSLATDHSLIKALLYGGTASVYACDTTGLLGCLNPHVSTITIAPSNGLASQVQTLLMGIVDNVNSQTPLTSQQIGLLNSTQIPVLKFINVESAVSSGQAIDVTKYTNLIAINILTQYLQESLQWVSISVHQLNWPTPIMQSFMLGINKAEQSIQNLHQTSWQEIATVQQLIAQTQQQERVLAGYLSTDVATQLNWANGEQ